MGMTAKRSPIPDTKLDIISSMPLRLLPIPIEDRDVRQAVGVHVRLGTGGVVCDDVGHQLAPAVEVFVGLLADQHARLVVLDQVGLLIPVPVDLLSRGPLLRVEVDDHVGLAVTVRILAL